MPLKQKCMQQFDTNRHAYHGHAWVKKENSHHSAKSRELQLTSAGRRAGPNRQTRETLVQNKTPICTDVDLLKPVTHEGQNWGVTCLALPSLKSSDSWQAHSIFLRDTVSWVFQCYCWHHEPPVFKPGTKHWKAFLHEQR